MSDAPLLVGLHSTWLPGAGLCWWLEGRERPVTGRRHPRALPARERRSLVRSWPSSWARALSSSGRQVWIRLPVRDGVPTTGGETPDGLAPVRVGVCVPPSDVSVLLEDVPSGVVVGPEVEWLRSLAADVSLLVRTGRVLPTVIDGRASWRLVPDHDVLAWREVRATSMPAALRAAAGTAAGHPATTVLADLLTVWVPQLVFARLAQEGDGFALPWRTGAEVSSRTDLTPVLASWAASDRDRTFRLVLRLDEPAPALDDDGGEVPGGERWPVDVLLRIDDDAPVALADLHADGPARDAAAHLLSRATALFPALRTAERDPFAPGRSWMATWTVCQLLDGGRDLLQRSGVEVLLPRDWARRATTLRLGVGSDDDPAIGLTGLLDWNWSVALGDVVLTEAELDRLAAEKSELVRLRGEWIRVDPAHLAQARRHVGRRARSGSTGELLGELLGDELPVPLGHVRATGWIRGLFDGGGSVPAIAQPTGLQADLRPYQLRGLAWLAFMDERGLGAVLADDMGLGKTIQVLSLLLHEREKGTAAGPTLLIAPTSLLTNWAREAARFAPGLTVLVHHGADRAPLLDLPAVDLVVTSYGVALRDVDDLCAVHWHRLVLDEAHVVKNSAGRQAGAVRRIPATHRLALTGTPVENRLLELRAVLDAVNPGLLGSVESFRRRFSVPIEKRRDPVALSRLQTVTRPFVLRREKSDRSIIADLPDKIEQVVPVALTAEQAALYRARVEDLLHRLPTLSAAERRAAVLATMVQLKQICNHPAHYLGDGSPVLRRGGGHRSGKLAALDDLITAALDAGEQVLLFTQFTAFGDMLTPHLQETFGIDVPFLRGSTPRKRRDAMVADFQAGRTPVLLLSLKAGGTGLNLTAATQVVHVDRWWNPSVENQATDRAYRIGQQRVVCVHKLMAVGTVEEKIDALIQGKSDLAALAVSAGEDWITELGAEALRELLTLEPEATR